MLGKELLLTSGEDTSPTLTVVARRGADNMGTGCTVKVYKSTGVVVEVKTVGRGESTPTASRVEQKFRFSQLSQSGAQIENDPSAYWGAKVTNLTQIPGTKNYTITDWGKDAVLDTVWLGPWAP